MNWWRAHHGISNDMKLALVSVRSAMKRHEVGWVWIILLDYASQNEPRGSIAGLDSDQIALAADLEPSQVDKILEAMKYRQMIQDDGVLTNWGKRQPKREREDDNSTERVRRFREMKRQNSPIETPRNHQRRGEESREEKKQHTPLSPLDEVFARFKEQYLSLGAACIEEDFTAAYTFCWKTLDWEQKAERMKALEAHASEYAADPRYIPKPVKFLEQEWKRPVRPTSSKGNKSLMLDRARDRLLAEGE